MSRTHDVTISAFDLDRLESELTRTEKERDEAIAYADQLAAGFPEGMLPKDVEVLREANHGLASELAAERALADRLADVLQRIANEDYRGNRPHHCEVAYYGVKAWKEARNE